MKDLQPFKKVKVRIMYLIVGNQESVSNHLRLALHLLQSTRSFFGLDFEPKEALL